MNELAMKRRKKNQDKGSAIQVSLDLVEAITQIGFPEERVPDNAKCPKCGETNMYKLYVHDDLETVDCETCGNTYNLVAQGYYRRDENGAN